MGCNTPFGKPDLIFKRRKISYVKKEKFTAERFVNEILQAGIPKIASLFEDNGVYDWKFQQDGDSTHRAKITQQTRRLFSHL